MRPAVLLLLVTSCAQAPAYVRAPVYRDPAPSAESLRAAQMREVAAEVSAFGDGLEGAADESCALLRALDAGVPRGECPP